MPGATRTYHDTCPDASAYAPADASKVTRVMVTALTNSDTGDDYFDEPEGNFATQGYPALNAGYENNYGEEFKL